MNILAIETSCDETAIALVDGTLENETLTGRVLANLLSSQIDIHKTYGGVVPSLAKREHQKKLVPLLRQALYEAGIPASPLTRLPKGMPAEMKDLLDREPNLYREILPFLREHSQPPADAIAVTVGPGLEPALWVGINFAKALSTAWNIPIIPTNHMKGHLFSPFIKKENINSRPLQFPALALLVSGGHTELVLMKDLATHQKLGMTRDDAAGEAFDKVARMLGLPYPGGPEISRYASLALPKNAPPITLPRPMIDSADYDFSFSGLKTAVLYTLKQLPEITEDVRIAVSKEFELAVIETLTRKTMRAAEEYYVQSILLGGGVAANASLRKKFKEKAKAADVELFLPNPQVTTDNAAMIAVAGLVDHRRQTTVLDNISANGTMSL